MNKDKMLSCATLPILGFAGASVAQGESGGGMRGNKARQIRR
jgi:hypothetical protein